MGGKGERDEGRREGEDRERHRVKRTHLN